MELADCTLYPTGLLRVWGCILMLSLITLDDFRRQPRPDPFRGCGEERRRVREIIALVEEEGDRALFRLTRELDGVALDDFLVSPEEFAAAENSLDHELLDAIRGAAENIRKFHRSQLPADSWQSGSGTLLGLRYLPLKSVGAYIPGGTAAYPSTVLMTTIPARLAGVENIYICTPPGADGRVNAATLAAAREAGVNSVFKVGGAQAVAALALGTAMIPAVDKIVGPGNIYVTLAKGEVFGRVGIDMLAGPSEIVIVAGAEGRPAYIAADMLSQAEHDPLSRSILITPNRPLAEAVQKALEKQLSSLPRSETAARSLETGGAIIVVGSLDEAWQAVEEIAPEHLELHFDEAWSHLHRIRSAGSVFLGHYTPETLGDYWAGTNHVLPTAAAARFASSLGVHDFLKRSQVLGYSREALLGVAAPLVTLARAEGLEGHARAVLRRVEDEPQEKD